MNAPVVKPASSKPRSCAAAGFTLIELLVVLAVIGVLVCLLIPAVVAAHAAAQSTACFNNLHQIGLATQQYVAVFHKYPTGYDSTPGQPVRRWMDVLKPCLEANLPTYSCPSDIQQIPCTWDASIILSYGINVFRFKDTAHCFWYSVADINVRRSKDVILFADCTPGDYWCGSGSQFADPVPYVDYRHKSGTFNVVYCDGHAESRTETTQKDWDASQ